MFANRERERERDWCRHIKVNIPSADRQLEREREREMCVCVFFLNFVSFFTLGTRLRIDLCKKSDRTRCLAVSILEYNINSKSAERAKAFWFSEEERNSVVIRRVNIGDPAYRIV